MLEGGVESGRVRRMRTEREAMLALELQLTRLKSRTEGPMPLLLHAHQIVLPPSICTPTRTAPLLITAPLPPTFARAVDKLFGWSEQKLQREAERAGCEKRG